MKAKIIELNPPIAGDVLSACIASTDVKAINEYMYQKTGHSLDPRTAPDSLGWVDKLKGRKDTIVIWIDPSLKGVDLASVIGHECIHATNMAMRAYGEKAPMKAEETFCYLWQYFFNEVYRALKK